MAQVNYDVGIVGGGPAGAAAAAYLARGGVKVGVFEREVFPRPHVGESLVPAANRVLAELGLVERMEAERFPHKYGAVWSTHRHLRQYNHDWADYTVSDAKVEFAERRQAGVDLPYTWHVDRGRFDQVLLEHAESLGAEVHQGTAVGGVQLDGPTPTLQLKRGAHRETVRVRMLVDASGRRTLLGGQLGIKRRDPVFDQFAVHTWFEDYDRTNGSGNAERSEDIHVHFLPLSNSWVWQIPITDRITSIGVVTQKKNFAASRAELEEFFKQAIGGRQEIAESVAKARQKAEGDYSYAMSQMAGDNYVLIGDAARFVDPIFSSGVSIALNSARLASADILAAAEAGDFSASRFERFQKTMSAGVRNWYTFISMYYRLNVLFTAFINDPRHRLDVLKLLQGDVYDEEEPPVLGRMREIVAEVEENPKHPWHTLLGDLTANGLRAAV